MKCLIGFALFFIAVGMFLALIIPNIFFELVIIAVCLMLGYNLFCC